jgi:hypothetical protein
LARKAERCTLIGRCPEAFDNQSSRYPKHNTHCDLASPQPNANVLTPLSLPKCKLIELRRPSIIRSPFPCDSARTCSAYTRKHRPTAHFWIRSQTCLSALETLGEKRRRARCLEIRRHRLEDFSVAHCNNHSSQMLQHQACSAPARLPLPPAVFSDQLHSNHRSKMLALACSAGHLGRPSNSSNNHKHRLPAFGVRWDRRSSHSSHSSSSSSSSSSNSLFGSSLQPAPGLNPVQAQSLQQTREGLPQLRQSTAQPYAGASINGHRMSIDWSLVSKLIQNRREVCHTTNPGAEQQMGS